MKHALLILALLQAPTPTPEVLREVPSSIQAPVGYYTEKPKPLPTPKKPGRYSVGFLADNGHAVPSVWHVNCHGATKDKCFAFKAEEYGRALFQIRDGDGPAGEGGPCDLGDLVRAGKAHLDREHPVVDEWMGAPGTTYMQTLAYKYCDHNPSTPACRVQRAEEALAAAKAAQDAEVKRLTILNTLRAELARCSPASKGGAR